MITNFKIFESLNKFLLCIKEPDTGFYLKLTKGKKYKIYESFKIGIRIKDDTKKFGRIEHWLWDKENIYGIITYRYAGCILTSANSIDDFNMIYNLKKYNL